jgi:membrane protease YdiL (CAAX protease family)
MVPLKLLMLVALLVGAGIALLEVWMRRRGRDPLGPAPRGDLPDTALALVASLVLWLLAQLFVPTFPPEVTVGALNGRTVTELVFTATHLVISFLLLRTALSGTLRPATSVARRVTVGLLAAVSMIAIEVVFGIVIDFVYSKLGLTLPVQDIVEESRTAVGADLAVRVVCAIAMAPFAEEVFFRGILLPAAARGMGPARGLVLQAALFGLVHCWSQWQAWPLAIPLAVVGWLAGWLYLRTGSLAAPIVMHATFNAANFVALRMSEKAASS